MVAATKTAEKSLTCLNLSFEVSEYNFSFLVLGIVRLYFMICREDFIPSS